MEEEKRKIIIPIGDGPVSAPKAGELFFDTQSTKNARPVVPLSGPGAQAKRSGKWKIVVVFLVVAVCAGVAAGAWALLFRGRGSGPQAAVQPVAGKTLSTLPWTHTPEDSVAKDETTPPVDGNNDTTTKANDTQARADRATDTRNQRRTNKQVRTRPGKKGADNDPDNPTKRTEDELHRIREIFEGPP